MIWVRLVWNRFGTGERDMGYGVWDLGTGWEGWGMHWVLDSEEFGMSDDHDNGHGIGVYDYLHLSS